MKRGIGAALGGVALAFALAPAAGQGAPKPKPAAAPKPLATFTVDRSGATPVNTYTYKVPNGVKKLRFELFGATGGTDRQGRAGGNGGKADATYLVSPGQVFQIVVGGEGQGGTLESAGGLNGGGSAIEGGGGGGASDVRVCADAAFKACGLADRFVVAGGGGGTRVYTGGAGGGLNGGSGAIGASPFELGPGPGQGGTQNAGGNGFAAGTFGFGGNAASEGGGGGGGWYGGGAGGGFGGGGGSGHISSPALSSSMANGVWTAGDGKVTIYKA